MSYYIVEYISFFNNNSHIEYFNKSKFIKQNNILFINVIIVKEQSLLIIDKLIYISFKSFVTKIDLKIISYKFNIFNSYYIFNSINKNNNISEIRFFLIYFIFIIVSLNFLS